MCCSLSKRRMLATNAGCVTHDTCLLNFLIIFFVLPFFVLPISSSSAIFLIESLCSLSLFFLFLNHNHNHNHSISHAGAADGSAWGKRKQQQPTAVRPRSGADVQAGELRTVLVCGGQRRITEEPSRSGNQRGEVALGEGGGSRSIRGRGRRERAQKQPQPHLISPQLGPSG